jgi:hypothetical protein
MMCRFLCADFELSIKCPLDQQTHNVRFQAYPQLRGDVLDVVQCDAKAHIDELNCGKVCRGLLESGEYWQTVYPESATFIHTQ